jgi:hypothetical protein
MPNYLRWGIPSAIEDIHSEFVHHYMGDQGRSEVINRLEELKTNIEHGGALPDDFTAGLALDTKNKILDIVAQLRNHIDNEDTERRKEEAIYTLDDYIGMEQIGLEGAGAEEEDVNMQMGGKHRRHRHRKTRRGNKKYSHRRRRVTRHRRSIRRRY